MKKELSVVKQKRSKNQLLFKVILMWGSYWAKNEIDCVAAIQYDTFILGYFNLCKNLYQGSAAATKPQI